MTFKRARSHNSGNITAKADEHRHKRFSGKADRAHAAIHHNGRPRKITGIFQKGETEEHRPDHRNKGGHGLNPRPDPFR